MARAVHVRVRERLALLIAPWFDPSVERDLLTRMTRGWWMLDEMPRRNGVWLWLRDYVAEHWQDWHGEPYPFAECDQAGLYTTWRDEDDLVHVEREWRG